MAQAEAHRSYPEGIGEEHTRRQSFVQHYLGWAALALLGALLALAMTGVLGGHPNPTLTADNDRAELSVNTPHILRSGEFFEMRFRVQARQPIAKPVLAVSHAYLRDLTLNTFKPSPAGESSDGTFYRMEFDALEAGEAFEVMIDGQVNPDLFGGTKGSIELLDDETPIARLPLELEIRP
jgi:hypothetical protein